MQDTKRLEDQHPAVGPGLAGALNSLRKGEEEDQGRQRRLVRSVNYWHGDGNR